MARFARLFLLALLASGLILVIVVWRSKHPQQNLPQKNTSQEKLRDAPKSAERLPLPQVQGGVPAKVKEEKKKVLRDVGGGIVAPTIEEFGNEDLATLERTDPLPQPTPPPAAEPQKVEKPRSISRWRIVNKSVVTSAGVIQAGDYELVLPGIEVIRADERCTLPDGRTWPCGKVARTAMRSLIKGKSISCKLPNVPLEKSFQADCLLRGRDLGLWLVTNGWARATDDGPYANEGNIAKQNRRGIFGLPEPGVELSDP